MLEVFTVASSLVSVVVESLIISAISLSWSPTFSQSDSIPLLTYPFVVFLFSFLYICFISYARSSKADICRSALVLLGILHLVGKNSTALLSLVPLVLGI